MNKITINVTQEDIDNGIRMDTNNCPVALAIKRAIPEATWVSVGPSYASVDTTFTRFKIFKVKKWLHLRLLLSYTNNFITAFDLGIPVKPLTIEADIEEWH